MSTFAQGNLFLLLSVLLSAGSQIVFKSLFNETGPISLSRSGLGAAALSPERFLRAALAFGMLGAGFVFWMLCLSRLRVSYAYPLACSSALLVTLFSVYFLNEAVTARTWVGTALIVFGTIFLAPTR